MTINTSLNNPVGWFEIHVSDMDRAKRFYEVVFQWPLERMTPSQGHAITQMYIFPVHATGTGSAGALVKGQELKSGDGGTVIYFSCANCASEVGRVTAAGGKIVSPKMPIGEYGFMALVHDTEGNTIGLHSRK